jgi:hypothetical protein
MGVSLHMLKGELHIRRCRWAGGGLVAYFWGLSYDGKLRHMIHGAKNNFLVLMSASDSIDTGRASIRAVSKYIPGA